MEDIMRIVRSLEKFVFFDKRCMWNNWGLLSGMLLGTLVAIWWGNMLASKRVMRAGEERIRERQGFWCHLIL